MPAPIIEAVTAMLICDGEVLLTRRQPQMPVFPGYWAFPGGKIDKTDSSEALAHPLLQPQDPRLLRALCRELQEELGFDLAGACADDEVTYLSEFGRALTPPFMPVRFDTRSYLIELRKKPAFTLDPREIAEIEWHPPAEFYARYERGRLLAAPPTVTTLRALAADPATRCIPVLNYEFDAERYVPCVEMIRGVRQLAVRSNTLPPADRTNAFLIGDTAETRFLVDPAPKNQAELERLLNTATPIGFSAVFLTHHHKDHREYADEIARRLKLPIHLSADTQERIQRKTRGRFFKDVEIKVRGEGEVLTQWLGEPVHIYAVPGHDAGQLALMPESRSWCIVSDLIQGIGTVVISKPEGNMSLYFESLRRVIELNPAVIFPSHGAALGTTYRLQATLAHRIERESQVLELHKKGYSSLRMLPSIYKGIDPRLYPLALRNIQSHLDKLRAESRI
ncbi:MAG: MBL fold metallo-hydrolase [Nevskiales bacterium]